MIMESMDNIVRGALINDGYSIHHYMQYLYYGLECLRELNFNVLRNVKPVMLNVNSYKAVDIPCDYVDYCKVGFTRGEYIVPLYERDSLNRLKNFDSNGNPIPWPNVFNLNNLPLNVDGNSLFFSYYSWYLSNINDKGESLGRQFNYGGGIQPGSFKVIPERNQIELDVNYDLSTVYLEYITDGTDVNNCNGDTMVIPYAISTIRAYIRWWNLERQRSVSSTEKQRAKDHYLDKLQELRRQKFHITIEDIRYSIRRSYQGALKN